MNPKSRAMTQGRYSDVMSKVASVRYRGDVISHAAVHGGARPAARESRDTSRTECKYPETRACPLYA